MAGIKFDAKMREAHQLAVVVRERAYAPYSNFHVGATLVTRDGKFVSGCNIENASYGGAVCAERVALLSAVRDGIRDITDIVVVTDAKKPACPCALCLQMMAEFCSPSTRIWICDLKKPKMVRTFKELLPLPFGPKQLREAK